MIGIAIHDKNRYLEGKCMELENEVGKGSEKVF